MTEPLESRVHALLKARDVLPVGRLNVIGLERLRNHFGEEWETIAPKVDTIAKRIIDRHLGQMDVVLEVDELAFVIMFSNLERHEAEIKSLFIAHEIARHVLGDDAALAADLVQAQVVDVDSATLQDTPTVIEELEALTRSSPPLSANQNMEWKALAKPDDQTLPDEVTLLYLPVWDVQHKAITTYHCIAARREGDDKLKTGYKALLAGERSPLIRELDLFMIDRVKHDLKYVHDNGKRVLMSCSVHADTFLDREHCTRMREALMGIEPELAKNLVIELVGIDHGMPMARLHEMAGFMRQRCRLVIARVDWRRPFVPRLREAAITTVSFDFACNKRNEATLFDQLNSAVAQAKGAGLKVLAQGLDSPSMAVAALGAGCDYVEGAAVHAPIETPENILRFWVDDMFAAVLNA